MNTNSIKTNERNYSSDYMDNKAFAIIENYVKENNPHLLGFDTALLDLFIVFKAEVLQNWKYIISSPYKRSPFYELTYDGDKKEWYLNVFKKFDEQIIKE